MSLSNTLVRASLLALTLSVGALASACTFTPVYSGTNAQTSAVRYAYAKPNNRLEQIVYQELALRFGVSTSPTAPLITISVGSNSRDQTLSQSRSPSKPKEYSVVVTATIVDRSGAQKPNVVITRRATANFTTNGQVLGERMAAEDASERAAKSAAESLRLALLASGVTR